MTNNAKNAIAGKPLVSGGILVAPLGTALPTTEVATPNAAFKSPGYMGDSGVVRSEKRGQEVKRAWGGDVIAILQKDATVTAKLQLVEYLNPVTQKAIYGAGNVTVTDATVSSGTKMTIKGVQVPCPHNSWIVEMFFGAARVRLVLVDAQITDLDDVTYKDDDLAARGVTLTLFPDSTGAYFYEYTDDGVFSA